MVDLVSGFKTFMTYVGKGSFNLLDNIVWDGIKHFAGDLFKDPVKAEKAIEYVQMYVRRRPSAHVEDLWQDAMVRLQDENEQLASCLRKRQRKLREQYGNKAVGAFHVLAVAYPENIHDSDERAKALETTYRRLVMYASMDDDDWSDEIQIYAVISTVEEKDPGLFDRLYKKLVQEPASKLSEDTENTGIVAWSDQIRQQAARWAGLEQEQQRNLFK